MKLKKLIESYENSYRILGNLIKGADGDIEILRKKAKITLDLAETSRINIKMREIVYNNKSYYKQQSVLIDAITTCKRHLKAAERLKA